MLEYWQEIGTDDARKYISAWKKRMKCFGSRLGYKRRVGERVRVKEGVEILLKGNLGDLFIEREEISLT